MDPIFLTASELDELDALLGAGEVSSGVCADVFALEGFLAAQVVGPAPGLADDGLLDLADAGVQAPRVLALMARHYSALSEQFRNNPDGYQPLYTRRGNGNRGAPVMERWCAGFLRAIQLHQPLWQPLLDDPQTQGLLLAATIFGKESGRQQMAAAPHLASQHQQIADRLTACTIAIYFYWLDRRSREGARGRPPIDLAVALCPCGSGKSFNHCCGVARTLH
jgi:uncharacterized protein